MILTPKILVTGGSGFIGTNLIIELKNQGYDVVNLSNHDPIVEVETIKLDLTKDDFDELDDHEFDYVVHLAAVSSIKLSQNNEKETMEINVEGTKRLLDYFSTNSARKRSDPRTKKNAPKGATNPLKKFIFMSSVTVYECEKSGQIEEDNALIGPDANAYACSKLIAEQECEKYTDKMPIMMLRLANAYGPYQRVGKTPNLIPQVVDQALREGKIEVYNGEFARDFVYVTDIVEAMILGLKSDSTGIFNLGTGIPTKVEDIAKVISDELKVEVTDLKRKIDAPLELVPNITHIKEELNWEPKVSLEEGLKKTIEYYRAAKGQPKKK